MTKKLIFFMLLIVLSNSCYAQDYRDVVYLKNGSVIKGFYKELYPTDTLRMETLDGGLLVCPMSEVERIAKERTDVYVVKQQNIEVKEWRPKGYRGFVEITSGMDVNDTHYTVTGVSTVHGYQFNKHFFAGLGLELDKYTQKKGDYTIQPVDDNLAIFADGRYNILKKRITPFVDARAGYNITGYRGFICSSSAGVDFGITPRMGICLSVGYQYMKYTFEDQTTRAHYLVGRAAFHF